jgi:hypothetical protein
MKRQTTKGIQNSRDAHLFSMRNLPSNSKASHRGSDAHRNQSKYDTIDGLTKGSIPGQDQRIQLTDKESRGEVIKARREPVSYSRMR